MLEIYTVIEQKVELFDDTVNKFLADGWELTKRELVVSPNGLMLLYAELERYTEPEEEKEPEDDTAYWEFSRQNIVKPYRCSKCQESFEKMRPVCPECGHRMTNYS